MTQQQGCRFVPYTFSANNWPQMVPLNLKIGETPGFFGGLDFLGPKSTTQKISWCIKCGGGCVVDFCCFGLFPLHPKGWLPIPASSATGRFEPLMCHLHGKIMEPRTLELTRWTPKAGWVGLFPAFFLGGDGRAPSKYDGRAPSK